MSLILTAADAVVLHVNVRKEGPAESKSLKVDLKLRCAAAREHLAYFHPQLGHFLFDAEDQVRIPILETLRIRNEIRHMGLVMSEGIEIRDAKLSKFTFEAFDGGRLDITFVAHFAPEGRQIALLAELIDEAVKLTVAPEAELPFGTGTP